MESSVQELDSGHRVDNRYATKAYGCVCVQVCVKECVCVCV